MGPLKTRCCCSRSRAASPSPSCQRLDLLGLEGTSPASSDGGHPLRHNSMEHRAAEGSSSPRKSPLSKQVSGEPADFSFTAEPQHLSGLTAAQWGHQLAGAGASPGAPQYGSDAGSTLSGDASPRPDSPVPIHPDLQQDGVGFAGMGAAAHDQQIVETPTLRRLVTPALQAAAVAAAAVPTTCATRPAPTAAKSADDGTPHGQSCRRTAASWHSRGA